MHCHILRGPEFLCLGARRVDNTCELLRVLELNIDLNNLVIEALRTEAIRGIEIESLVVFVILGRGYLDGLDLVGADLEHRDDLRVILGRNLDGGLDSKVKATGGNLTLRR